MNYTSAFTEPESVAVATVREVSKPRLRVEAVFCLFLLLVPPCSSIRLENKLFPAFCLEDLNFPSSVWRPTHDRSILVGKSGTFGSYALQSLPYCVHIVKVVFHTFGVFCPRNKLVGIDRSAGLEPAHPVHDRTGYLSPQRGGDRRLQMIEEVGDLLVLVGA